MYESVISINVSDIIHLILSLAACYACFHWGRREGIVDLATMLVENGTITEKDLEKDFD